MSGYFYTLDMGTIYGPRLQKLAVHHGIDDVEEFAAMLLAYAIDTMESCVVERMDTSGIVAENDPDATEGADDSIPF